jgi:hypothetical protein
MKLTVEVMSAGNRCGKKKDDVLGDVYKIQSETLTDVLKETNDDNMTATHSNREKCCNKMLSDLDKTFAMIREFTMKTEARLVYTDLMDRETLKRKELEDLMRPTMVEQQRLKNQRILSPREWNVQTKQPVPRVLNVTCTSRCNDTDRSLACGREFGGSRDEEPEFTDDESELTDDEPTGEELEHDDVGDSEDEEPEFPYEFTDKDQEYFNYTDEELAADHRYVLQNLKKYMHYGNTTLPSYMRKANRYTNPDRVDGFNAIQDELVDYIQKLLNSYSDTEEELQELIELVENNENNSQVTRVQVFFRDVLKYGYMCSFEDETIHFLMDCCMDPTMYPDSE